jgi:hypothetical protein
MWSEVVSKCLPPYPHEESKHCCDQLLAPGAMHRFGLAAWGKCFVRAMHLTLTLDLWSVLAGVVWYNLQSQRFALVGR